jgi:hypothetical protein
MMETQVEKTVLEQFEEAIDRGNVASVLDVIVTVMREKSAHIAENWQDAALAIAWDQSASVVEKAAAKLRGAGIPGIGR